MKFSDVTNLNVNLSPLQSRDRLIINTLQRSSLVVEKTEKQFIGQVNEYGFKIISATAFGSLCIAEGHFKQNDNTTNVQIIMKMNKVFLYLLTIWFVSLTIVISFFSIKNASLSSFVIQFSYLIIGGMIFSILLNSAYSKSRKITLDKIETILAK